MRSSEVLRIKDRTLKMLYDLHKWTIGEEQQDHQKENELQINE